jgi:hypothetical protein
MLVEDLDIRRAEMPSMPPARARKSLRLIAGMVRTSTEGRREPTVLERTVYLQPRHRWYASRSTPKRLAPKPLHGNALRAQHLVLQGIHGCGGLIDCADEIE